MEVEIGAEDMSTDREGRILHCGQPMEVIRMPSGSPLAPGMPVGLRCLVCGELVPNALIGFMEERTGKPLEQE